MNQQVLLRKAEGYEDDLRSRFDNGPLDAVDLGGILLEARRRAEGASDIKAFVTPGQYVRCALRNTRISAQQKYRLASAACSITNGPDHVRSSDTLGQQSSD
ncbi:MAG TPA: hypothetical protein VK778_08580 [Solirubrobacteraceae bacterium]|nr:hypothetical protein [Solirubrobacteraceae bacterium]